MGWVGVSGACSSDAVYCGDFVRGRGEGTSDALVMCEPKPEFRRFGAEADAVSEVGGRVVGMGSAASLYNLFPGRLREDRFTEGGVADFV